MKHKGLCCLLLSAVFLTSPIGCRKEAAETGPDSVANSSSTASETPTKTTTPTAELAKKTESAKSSVPKFVNKYFEAPFRLMVGNDPLNTKAKQMYPSPAMFDVDNDGQSELIVGDIFGSLNVYENQNATEGDPVWNDHYALNSSDGEAIKVSNW